MPESTEACNFEILVPSDIRTLNRLNDHLECNDLTLKEFFGDDKVLPGKVNNPQGHEDLVSPLTPSSNT